MDLKLKLSVLVPRIGKEFSQDYLVIGEIKSDGAALITFRIVHPGQVPVAPQRDCGERLVKYLAIVPTARHGQQYNKGGHIAGRGPPWGLSIPPHLFPVLLKATSCFGHRTLLQE